MAILRTTIFGRQKIKPNTFIGGIAKLGGTGVDAPITMAALLASKLGISESRIRVFKVIGENIECNIVGDYNLTGGSQPVFPNTLTYFIDNDQLLKSFGNNNFVNMINLEVFRAYGIKHFTNGGYPKMTNTKVEELFFPNLTDLGIGSMGNGSFLNNTQLKRFILPNANFSSKKSGNTWLSGSLLLEEIDMRKAKIISRTTYTSIGVVGANPATGSIARFNEAVTNWNGTGNPDDAIVYLRQRGWTVKLYNDAGVYVGDFTI